MKGELGDLTPGLPRNQGCEGFQLIICATQLVVMYMTWIKVANLYMKPKFLIAAKHDTILNLGVGYGVCFEHTWFS